MIFFRCPCGNVGGQYEPHHPPPTCMRCGECKSSLTNAPHEHAQPALHEFLERKVHDERGHLRKMQVCAGCGESAGHLWRNEEHDDAAALRAAS